MLWGIAFMPTASTRLPKLIFGLGLTTATTIAAFACNSASAFSPLPPTVTITTPDEAVINSCTDGAWGDWANPKIVYQSLCATQPGDSQADPILPDIIEKSRFIFRGVPSGRWFDPPMTPGFRYEMLSGSLFTQLLNLPTGIDSNETFTVSVGNLLLGQFHSSESVDFVSLLGAGVSEFTIAGINPTVNSQDPIAFPVRLGFDTPTADFSMQPISSAAVPEPSTMIGLLVAGASGAALLRRQKKSG
jgi:hypothetical protein